MYNYEVRLFCSNLGKNHITVNNSMNVLKCKYSACVLGIKSCILVNKLCWNVFKSTGALNYKTEWSTCILGSYSHNKGNLLQMSWIQCSNDHYGVKSASKFYAQCRLHILYKTRCTIIADTAQGALHSIRSLLITVNYQIGVKNALFLHQRLLIKFKTKKNWRKTSWYVIFGV